MILSPPHPNEKLCCLQNSQNIDGFVQNNAQGFSEFIKLDLKKTH